MLCQSTGLQLGMAGAIFAVNCEIQPVMSSNYIFRSEMVVVMSQNGEKNLKFL
jgi:hypothetical protein